MIIIIIIIIVIISSIIIIIIIMITTIIIGQGEARACRVQLATSGRRVDLPTDHRDLPGR